MTEIIVYRNPVEAAFWNAVSSGELFPILVGVIVGIMAVMIAAWVSDRVYVRKRQPKWVGTAQLTVGALAGVATAYAMWI